VLIGHPVDCDDTRAGLLKIAALYTMNPYWKQSPPGLRVCPTFL
jgi:hypothetical protein